MKYLSKLKKKINKLIKKIKIIIDYIGFVIFFFLAITVYIASKPWILKQRRIWESVAKGNNKSLIIHTLTLGKVQERGYEYLLPFRNPSVSWTGFFDPANTQEGTTKIADDLYIILKKKPKFFSYLESKGFEATSIPLRELFIAFRIINYCIEDRIGVLRAYKHDYAALRNYLVSRFIKIPYIIDISTNFELIYRLTGRRYYFKVMHKIPVFGIFSHFITNWLYGLPLRHASLVIGRDKNMYEHAFALGASVERLALSRLSNYDDRFNIFDPEKIPARPIEQSYFLLVGRLAPIKFPVDAIEAFDLVAAEIPEHHLIIIGDGPLRKELEQRIQRSAHKDRIVLMGLCSSKTVFDFTVHASAAICPFSGSTLIEAMLCGTPVIAYDIVGHPEIVFDDFTGFIVPFRDTVALADKMIYVAKHQEVAKKIGLQGRDFARVVFDKEKILQKESMHYKQILKL